MKMLKCVVLAAAAAVVGAPVHAADYPSRNIDLVVPFNPGGAVDTTSRMAAETAKKFLNGIEIKIINKDGGGGVVGQTFAARAKPDGYTMLAITNSAVSSPLLKGAPFKITDFTAVGLYTIDPEVIAVPDTSPFKTITDFMTAAKKRKLNIVSSGAGTSHHMAGLAIELGAKVEFTYVFSRGFGEELQAMLGGHVDGALWPFGIAKQQVAGGGTRILAVASDEAMPGFESVPTWEKSGLGVPAWQTFRGWAVPKGTPQEIVTFLSDLLKKVTAEPDYRAKMDKAGFPVVYRNAEGFAKTIAEEDALTRRIMKEKGLTLKK